MKDIFKKDEDDKDEKKDPKKMVGFFGLVRPLVQIRSDEGEKILSASSFGLPTQSTSVTC